MTADPCKPEWCETGAEPHSDVCDNAPMPPMTKREFVDFMRTAADYGIEQYSWMLDEEDFAPKEAKSMAVDGTVEAATCHAGIGSCGRGWCRHS